MSGTRKCNPDDISIEENAAHCPDLMAEITWDGQAVSKRI
jgi:hypothetical protein